MFFSFCLETTQGIFSDHQIYSLLRLENRKDDDLGNKLGHIQVPKNGKIHVKFQFFEISKISNYFFSLV